MDDDEEVDKATTPQGGTEEDPSDRVGPAPRVYPPLPSDPLLSVQVRRPNERPPPPPGGSSRGLFDLVWSLSQEAFNEVFGRGDRHEGLGRNGRKEGGKPKDFPTLDHANPQPPNLLLGTWIPDLYWK